jgi:hypothetical protein
MKKIAVIIASLVYLVSFGQTGNAKLKISRLTGDFYIYTTYNDYQGYKMPAHGMYLVTDDGVAMFDTPWDTTQFQPLLAEEIQNKMSYEVETFDVKENIPKFSLFNQYYKTGAWKPFWDLLNFKREVYPTYFILQNSQFLDNKIRQKIEDLIILYNHKSTGVEVLHDSTLKVDPQKFNSLFFDDPGPWF